MALSNFTKSVASLALMGAFALSGAASAGSGKGDLNSWASKAGEAVDDVMTYPSMRIRGNGSGNAIFRVTIDRSGEVVSSEQLERPNSVILNAAAKAVVKKAEFPSLPNSLDRDTLTFQLHLSYGASARDIEKLRPGRVTSRQLAGKKAPVVAALRIIPAGE